MKKNLLLIFAINFMQLLVTSAVLAQPWAEAMFQERRHSFGNVALGSEAIYRFQFKNPYSDDIHIASVRSSCACTTPDWPKTAIKFGETAEIVAKLNTDGQYTGERKATLTVVIDRPSRAEVQLQVTGYIRHDVVISPAGRAEFGTVSEGVEVQKVLTLQHAGRTNSNWELIDVECSNPHIQVDAKGVAMNNGRVEYKIFVTILKTMPSGYVHDIVRFTTNDVNPNASVIMIPVYGFVTAPLVAKPSPLIVGFVQPGETIKKNVVLHSDVPFRITKVTSKDRRFQFALPKDDNNNIHVLPIAFAADSSLGTLNEPIIIHTTLAGQKQMQLLTQGMVYDVSLLDEHQGRLKHQLAGQSQEQSPGQLPGPTRPADSPPTFREDTKIASLPQPGSPRVQIRMGPTETASQGEPLQKTPNNIVINMNTEEKQSEEIAVAIIDAADKPHEADEIAVVRQEETNMSVPELKAVPRLAHGESAMGFEAANTTTQPQVTMQQEPDVSLIPTTTGDQLPAKDLMEAPFQVITESAAERTTIESLTPITAVPTQNTEAESPSDFQVMENDTPIQQQPVSPNVNRQTDHRPETARPGALVDQPAIEHTFTDSSLTSSSSLTFSPPSVKTNLEAFTKTKPQPIVNSNDPFAIVDDSKNAVSGNGTSPPTSASSRETRVISVMPPPNIPPVPDMKPTQAPVVSPFTPAPATPENEIPKKAELPPEISNNSSNRLLSPPFPAETIASPGVLDSNLIAEMFGEAKISDTTNSTVAQAPPQEPVRSGNLDEQGGLKPMELQPLQSGNPGTLNVRMMTIAPMPEEGLEYEEVEEDSISGQPGVILPPFERNPRWNTVNSNREQMTLDVDLPMNMPNNLMTPGAGQLGPESIVKGAPIPTMPPARQPGSNQMSAKQIPPLPANMPQRPGNVPQHPGVQPPQPGNSQQTVQLQAAQPRLTPQQMQQMQQMQRNQQMQELQRIQMQQRQATAAQQPSRATTQTPPQQSRVATNPRPPQQQPLVVPPAPTVPNTPMMPSAPMFR